MFTIIKGQANTVVLTLSEKTTITNPVYLFEFTNVSTNDVKTFIAQDVSINKLRYNEFTITENVTENLLNGTVSLLDNDYLCNVYEQSSTTNLVVANAHALVEPSVKVRVEYAVTSSTEYEPQSTNTIEYNG